MRIYVPPLSSALVFDHIMDELSDFLMASWLFLYSIKSCLLKEIIYLHSYKFCSAELIDAVEEAAKCMVTDIDNGETMSQIALNHLCPALYAILNHGLKPTLETAFGDIGNSVWQVVEASSQQGMCTRGHESRSV